MGNHLLKVSRRSLPADYGRYGSRNQHELGGKLMSLSRSRRSTGSDEDEPGPEPCTRTSMVRSGVEADMSLHIEDGTRQAAYDNSPSPRSCEFVTPDSSPRCGVVFASRKLKRISMILSIPTPQQRAQSARERRPQHNVSRGEEWPDLRRVFSAARHGRYREVEQAFAMGFDPCSQDSFGNTLFHIACQNCNKRMGKLAIKNGGNMDIQNCRGNTGLHFLFAYGYVDIAEYFVSKGADETLQNVLRLPARAGLR